jgi:hypothetical protein
MKVINLLIIGSLIILILPLWLYYDHFGSNTYSGNFKDWVDFSQYYTLFFAVFNGVILLLLTWRIHKENISLNKPLLVFTIDAGKKYSHSIKNIGNGPALNIEIYASKVDGKWNQRIKGLTLGKGEDYELHIDGQLRLGAIYYDQSGNRDKCYMRDTFMHFKNIESHFNQKIDQELLVWQLPSK